MMLRETAYPAMWQTMVLRLLLEGAYPKETIEQTISVGPNPTTGQLKVSLSRFGKENICNLLLVNASGQTLISQAMTSSQAILDLSQYASGYYLLKVELNNNVTTHKIIKK